MADNWGSYVLPCMIVGIVAFGLYKRVKVFDCFMLGAKKGLHTVYELMPSITGLVVAVSMLKESGAMEIISSVLRPVTSIFGVPEEITPMALLSPVSGGGSLSLFENVLKNYGPDSFVGQVASVVMGSTDTTLYAVTVYYAAANIKNTRHTLLAGLTADFMSLVLSAFFVRLTVG